MTAEEPLDRAADPGVLANLNALSDIDFKRVGLIAVTAALMTRPHGVVIRAAGDGNWEVTVSRSGARRVFKDKGRCSTALDRALLWLLSKDEGGGASAAQE